MKLYLHEIKELGTELDFTEADTWLMKAVYACDEHAQNELTPAKPKPRSAHARLEFRQVDEVVVINGRISTQVQLLCSAALPLIYLISSLNSRP